MIVRTREVADGSESCESTVLISSRSAKFREQSRFLREYCGVENKLHDTLDVTFADEASRIRKANGPENSFGFRRLALAILQLDTTVQDNIRGKRVLAEWNTKHRQSILQSFHARTAA